MNGKAYYLFGAFPMLFAAGGTAIERILKSRGVVLQSLAVAFLLLPHLFLLPLLLPILSVNQTVGYYQSNKKLGIVQSLVTWEDHKQHAISQDYADMFGWEEMTAVAAKAYNSLTPEQQQQTIIFASNYGQAGAIHQFHKSYHIPDAISLNSSFALWAPEQPHFDYIIYIDDTNEADVSDLVPIVESWKLTGTVTDTLSREHGTGVFLLTHPKPALLKLYQTKLAKTKLQ